MALARRILAIPVAALVVFRTAVQCLSQQEVTGHALDHLAGISTVIMPSSTSMLKIPTPYTARLQPFNHHPFARSSASRLDAEKRPDGGRLHGRRAAVNRA